MLSEGLLSAVPERVRKHRMILDRNRTDLGVHIEHSLFELHAVAVVDTGSLWEDQQTVRALTMDVVVDPGKKQKSNEK